MGSGRTVTFLIPGPPQGKARPRVVRGAGGRVHTYTPDGTAAYERLVREQYRKAARIPAGGIPAGGIPAGGIPAGGVQFPDEAAIRLTVTAGFPVPKSASRKNRARMLAGEIRPAKRPDFDNIGKIIADALNGVAYRDDAQIVEAQVVKIYVDGPGETTVTIGTVGKED